MFERFTDRARRVLVLAQEESRLLRHDCIAPEHLLLGLLGEGEGIAAQALGSLEVSAAEVRELVTARVAVGETDPVASPPFTEGAKRLLELSLREALGLGHNYIGTEHLLLALTREDYGVASEVLAALGATPRPLRERVVWLLSAADPLPAVDAEDVLASDPAPDPADLLTEDDVEAVWRDRPLGGSRKEGVRQVGGLPYRWTRIEPRALPSAWLAVAAAQVTVEAFDRYSGVLGPDAAPVEGIGDRATFDARSGALRVLSGSTLFVLTVVGGHPRSFDLATALAGRVLARLGP